MKPGGRLWLGLCAVLGTGACIGRLLPAGSADWQPALASTQPWRWWTAAFVHASGWHLAANLAGLVLVGALGRAASLPAMAAVAWLACWPLLHLALLARPDLLHYGGLSGLLHGGVAVAATWLVASSRSRDRLVGCALWAGLLAKVLVEAPWGPAVRPLPDFGVAIAPLAHAAGVVCGALCAVTALAREPHRRAA